MAENIRPMTVAQLERLWRRSRAEATYPDQTYRRAYLRGFVRFAGPTLTARQLKAQLARR